jgi:hypothetical protein
VICASVTPPSDAVSRRSDQSDEGIQHTLHPLILEQVQLLAREQGGHAQATETDRPLVMERRAVALVGGQLVVLGEQIAGRRVVKRAFDGAHKHRTDHTRRQFGVGHLAAHAQELDRRQQGRLAPALVRAIGHEMVHHLGPAPVGGRLDPLPLQGPRTDRTVGGVRPAEVVGDRCAVGVHFHAAAEPVVRPFAKRIGQPVRVYQLIAGRRSPAALTPLDQRQGVAGGDPILKGDPLHLPLAVGAREIAELERVCRLRRPFRLDHAGPLVRGLERDTQGPVPRGELEAQARADRVIGVGLQRRPGLRDIAQDVPEPSDGRVALAQPGPIRRQQRRGPGEHLARERIGRVVRGPPRR